MTKIATIQGALIPFIYYIDDREAYKAAYGAYPQLIGGSSDSTKTGYRTKRLDNLRIAAISHAALWGTQALLNMFAMTGLCRFCAAFWLEHVVSNFEWVIYGYVIYRLIDASYHWFDVLSYILSMVTLWAAVTFFFGMGTIKFLRPDYPYLDGNLYPSIFFLLGISDHLT